MYKQITIKTLHDQGMKKAAIARTLGCHRNTVGKVLKREKVIAKQTRQKLSGLDPYKLKIKEWLDQKITRLRVHEKLQEAYGDTGTYANLCFYIKGYRPEFNVGAR
jgi:transposase